jgi:hypothetical protein
VNLIEELAALDYEDFRQDFPGSPLNHGFEPWEKCTLDYRAIKTGRMEKIMRNLASRIEDQSVRAAILGSLGLSSTEGTP